MIEQYIKVDLKSDRTLQDQIKEQLIAAILSDHVQVGEAMPSSRGLSERLGVSRNTVVLTYESLVDAGFLTSQKRRGYFVAPGHSALALSGTASSTLSPAQVPDWTARYVRSSSEDQNIVKPNNWASMEFPFVYGQVQNEFFPIAQWRDCARKVMGAANVGDWVNDSFETDDTELIEQIRTRLLPRRGVYATSSEILITVGTQNSLYLLANLLFSQKTRVAMENPGFRDAFNIFRNFEADVQLYPVDSSGIVLDGTLWESDYVYLTPSHQVPTGTVLSEERRAALLAAAAQHDFIVIEDDYDAEINMQDEPIAALKANDRNQRVVYLSSLSKAISPGIRVGYMVADEALISEARALRRLMYRHPATNNQRLVALFLAQGHYDSYLRKLKIMNATKYERMRSAIQRHLPGLLVGEPSPGSSAFWLRLPDAVNAERLARRLVAQGVLIEPGTVHFLASVQPTNYFRLGYGAIPPHKIERGLELIAAAIDAD